MDEFDKLTELCSQMEDINWEDVPNISVNEAAAFTARFDESRKSLK